MRSGFLFLIAFVCIVLHTTCSSPIHNEKNTIYINQTTGVENLDCAFAKSLWVMWHCENIYNRLVVNGSDMTIQPSLAKAWRISADRCHYIFDLRTDVFFQDNEAFAQGKGRRMTAHDVVYSFNRLLDEATNSPGAWIFNGKVDSLKPFVALNDSTVQINLIQPFTPLLNILSMHYAGIVPQEVVQRWGKDYRSHPCGTGPYQLKYWDEGNVAVYEKNNHYWEVDSAGNHLPYTQYLKFTFVDSKASEFLMFGQGKIDFMNGVDASFKDQVLTKQGELKPAYKNKIVLQQTPYLNVEYLGILVDSNKLAASKLLQNVKVRGAINRAFDKQELVTYLRNNIGVPGNCGMIPRGLLGFDSAQQQVPLYDVATAKKLLNGINTQEVLTLFLPDMYEDRCSFVAEKLAQIGIKVKVEIIQQAMLREKISQSGAALFWATWIADYGDAESYLSMFYSKNSAPPNYTRFCNAAYDKLYEQALQETDAQKLKSLYMAMDKIIATEVPAIPLFYDEVSHFLQPNVKGWRSNALNVVPLKYVYKE